VNIRSGVVLIESLFVVIVVVIQCIVIVEGDPPPTAASSLSLTEIFGEYLVKKNHLVNTNLNVCIPKYIILMNYSLPCMYCIQQKTSLDTAYQYGEGGSPSLL